MVGHIQVQHRRTHRFSRCRMRRMRCCSSGEAACRLLQKVRGREGRRRCNGLHVHVERRGKDMFRMGSWYSTGERDDLDAKSKGTRRTVSRTRPRGLRPET